MPLVVSLWRHHTLDLTSDFEWTSLVLCQCEHFSVKCVAVNQLIQRHRQPGVRQPVLEEGADTDRVRVVPRDNEHTEGYQLQGLLSERSIFGRESLFSS